MSRQKIATDPVMRVLREEAKRRVEYRSNKELSRELADALGVHLTPQYVGKLVAEEARQLRRKRNILVRMFHGEPAETEGSSGTIRG